MRKNFCAAPWSGISFDPDGKVKVCCVSNNRIPLTSFSQISSNTDFIEIRKAFIADQQHTNCSACWHSEKNGDAQESRRSIYQYDDYFHNLESAESFQLEHLDLRWSNTCNLNCVYCNPVYSSKWAEIKNLSQSFKIFPEVLDSDLKNLKTLQLAGGEPLLIKQNGHILERLLKINSSINIEITSNLTQIKNNRIYELLKQFDHVTWIVSFESVGRRFEYIRNGAVWDEFLINLKQLTFDFQNVQVNMVYFPLSSGDIKTAITVALEHVPADNIFIATQIGGHGFDMLGKNALQLINDANTHFASRLPEVIKNRLLTQIKLATTNREASDLPKYKEFDQLTNQNHKEVFPELYE